MNKYRRYERPVRDEYKPRKGLILILIFVFIIGYLSKEQFKLMMKHGFTINNGTAYTLDIPTEHVPVQPVKPIQPKPEEVVEHKPDTLKRVVKIKVVTDTVVQIVNKTVDIKIDTANLQENPQKVDTVELKSEEEIEVIESNQTKPDTEPDKKKKRKNRRKNRR
jgi:hypothetical protein